MISQEQLFAWCEAHKAEQLALLKELAAIPSPSHHEEKRAEFIKAWLEKAGAKNVTIDPALNVLLPFGAHRRRLPRHHSPARRGKARRHAPRPRRWR